ncbi:hypothetical protein COO60DRAFT_1492525 [Scenedesmus sp. NREL 46B-D3]|nr:hypothetical protein COO60DRAFT_1492525 [Scenedesmus sp. NREL 46B-D3]
MWYAEQSVTATKLLADPGSCACHVPLNDLLLLMLPNSIQRITRSVDGSNGQALLLHILYKSALQASRSNDAAAGRCCTLIMTCLMWDRISSGYSSMAVVAWRRSVRHLPWGAQHKAQVRHHVFFVWCSLQGSARLNVPGSIVLRRSRTCRPQSQLWMSPPTKPAPIPSCTMQPKLRRTRHGRDSHKARVPSTSSLDRQATAA